ncbi:hypothetical protein PXH80_33985, partial [Mycolicibacterium smegmatis]|nr:hypothetical protein [Mycolicibacterium smegmatis]
DPKTLEDLVFAWRACRAVKSNAIVVARDGATVGVGMGQVNRVGQPLRERRRGQRAPPDLGADADERADRVHSEDAAEGPQR